MKMCCESQTAEISLTVGFDFVLIWLIVHRHKGKPLAEHRGFSVGKRKVIRDGNNRSFEDRSLISGTVIQLYFTTQKHTDPLG